MSSMAFGPSAVLPTSSLLPNTTLFGVPPIGSMQTPQSAYGPAGSPFLSFGLPGGGYHVGGSTGATPAPQLTLENYPLMIPGVRPGLSATISGLSPAQQDAWMKALYPASPLTKGGKAAPGKPATTLPFATTPFPDISSLLGAGAGSGMSPAAIAAALKATAAGVPQLKAPTISYSPLTANLPSFTNPYPTEAKILNAGLNAYLGKMGNQQKALAAFAASLQHLPDLTGLATLRAQGMLTPQVRAALQAAANNAKLELLLGQSSAGLQRGLANDLAPSYTNAAKAIQLLAGGIGGQATGTTAAELSRIPGALGATLPGNIAASNLAPGTAQAITQMMGNAPAANLLAQGPFGAQAAQAGAETLLGAAQNASRLASAAGGQQANQIEAQLPTLQNQVLNQLQTQQSSQLDRELQLLQASGQLNSSEADAIRQSYAANAQAFGEATSQQNAYSGTRASILNQTQAANANMNLQTQMDNANLQIQTAAANRANVNSAISQWIALYKLTNPTGATLSAANQAKISQQMGKTLDGFMPSKGKTSTTTGTTPAGPTSSTTVSGGKTATPIAQAWKSFYTQYRTTLPAPALLQIFKSYMRIPDNWSEANVEQNFGPLMTTGGKLVNGRIRNGGATWEINGKMHDALTPVTTGSDATVSRGSGGGNAAQTTASTTPISSFSSSDKGGGFLPQGAIYNQNRADQGRDLATNPGGPIIAPGDGYLIRNGYDPNGFGTSYPIVHFTSGPYAGQDMYIGHTMSQLSGNSTFTAGQVLSYTGKTGGESWNGNATTPGWAEIGFAPGGTPGAFGQRTPFG